MHREAAVGEKPIGKSEGIDVRALRAFSEFTPAGTMSRSYRTDEITEIQPIPDAGSVMLFEMKRPRTSTADSD